MKYSQATEYLNSFINYAGIGKGREFPRYMKKLGRINRLLRHYENPQRGLRTVLITGTKGKGSAAAMLESILRRAGHTTGLYSSPHLLSVRERIQLNGRPVSRKIFSTAIEALRPYLDTFADRMGPTTPSYFEILTTMAFCIFRDKHVNTAILEVGMGGKYDATNSADPCLAIIMPISLEHTEYLGGTISRIAHEKSGIMRPGIPVITSALHKGAARVIRNRAAKLDCPLLRLGKEFAVTSEGKTFDWQAGARNLTGLKSPFSGVHQRENAAVAVAGALELKRTQKLHITRDAIRNGLRRARIRGRIDIVRKKPLIIIDTAHTRDSIEALRVTVKSEYGDRPVFGIFNLSTDKDLASIARAFPHNLKKLYIPPTDNPRNYEPKILADKLARLGIAAKTTSTVPRAIQYALRGAGSKGLVLVFGSFFLAGMAYQSLGIGPKD